MNKSEYKNKILNILIKDETLAQLLLNKNKDYNSISYSDIEKVKMKNKNIFTYMLNPKALKDVESIVMLQFTFKYNNTQINDIFLNVEVYVHNTLQDTIKEDRSDLIVEKIKELITSSNDLGTGKMKLMIESDLSSINEEYIVSKLSFQNMTISRGY